MSDTEEETFYFGTPLEPYDEDAFPKKRPIPLEDQVVKDTHGRRRFHGAFTGGFSAGFFNTVGSVQGWTPSEFKSSRDEKASNKQQKPEDFMDEEDLGEFGIAPQAIKATKEYSTNKKRRRQQVFNDGLIPGEPVLETLLQAGNETVGYFLMKNMNRKYKVLESTSSGPRVYGCVMPKDLPEDDACNVVQYVLHEIYSQYLSKPKVNTNGLGYVGLDKMHSVLFESAKLTVHERNNKKLSIAGQAFGVGAFEDEDEDIYVKDNMNKYDFELTPESSGKQKKVPSKRESLILDGFVFSKNVLLPKTEFPPPVIPASFTGKHKVKKSRFEPLQEETNEDKGANDRRDMDATVRAKYLGEDHLEKTPTPSDRQHKKQHSNQEQKETEKEETKEKPWMLPSSSSGLIFDKFVSAKQEDDVTNILEEVKCSETTHGTKEMHDAVKLKMFGPLTRLTLTWQPCSFLCKRFNVPETTNDEMNAQKNKKRTKNLIFEYQKHQENNDLPLKPGLLSKTTVKQEQEDPVDVSENQNTLPNTTIKIKEEDPSTSDITVRVQTEEIQGDEVKDNGSNTIIDITDRVDVSKNIDLFKAVFLSSSDESDAESEEEAIEKDKEAEKRKEILTANVLSEPLVPKIKSTKEGILSNIDFSKFNKSSDQSEQGRNETNDVKIRDSNVDTYGPRLPTITPSAYKPVNIGESVNDDEWVEKDKLGVKDRRHKKKHKKEKHRDKDKHKKKHKHKSKG